MTGVIAIVAVCALTYVVLQRESRISVIFVSSGLCMLGIFGALIAAKYYERQQMHMSGAQTLRWRLNELFPELHIEEDWSQNRSRHQQRFTMLYKVRLYYLWVTMHVGIAVTGFVLTVVMLTNLR